MAEHSPVPRVNNQSSISHDKSNKNKCPYLKQISMECA